MKSIKRICLLVVLSLLMCLSFAIVGLSTNKVSADTLSPTTFQMDEGTSAKLSEVAGLRFRVKVDTETKNKIINEDNTTLTFVITPKVFITCVEDYKTVAQKITMSADEGMFYQEDEESDIWYANCVITKIKEANYKLDYSCVAYISDGETTTYATNFAYNNLYATLNSALVDTDYPYAWGVFGFYKWFGSESYPIVVDNQEQLDYVMGQREELGNPDWTKYTVHAPNGVTNKDIQIEKSYTVTFKDYDGTLLKKISVKAGETISSLPMVVTSNTGKKIYGYKDTNNTYFTTDTEINSDIELTAQIMSVGLAYTLINNDTEYEVKKGTCTDTELIIPETFNGKPVTSIGYMAFEDCSSLTSIEIPDSVTSIGYWAFHNCLSLTSVEIPESVEVLDSSAFGYCIKLQYNEYDSGYYIGNSNNPYLVLMKAKSKDITSCIINENCRFIHIVAFENCSSLTSIEIPDSVTSIGYEAFSYCSSLTSIEIGEGVTSIGYCAFFKCSSLTSIQIPDSVTSIGNDAFSYCSSLTNLEIPDSVISIGIQAFYHCSSLTSVVIGNNVTSIGSWAFEDCSSLTSVYYKGTESVWNNISIGSGNDELTSATKYYYSESYPENFAENTYWHYENDEIVIWKKSGEFTPFYPPSGF